MLKTEILVFLVINVLSAFGSYHNLPGGHPGKFAQSFEMRKLFELRLVRADHPGKCWFEEKQIEMNVGDKITSTNLKCVQYTCEKNDKGFDFTKFGYGKDYGFFFSRQR